MMNSCKRSNILVSQKTGQSMKEVMSLKAITDLFNRVDSDISTELNARIEADNKLTADLNQEIKDRKDADDAITEKLDLEIKDRQNGDEALSNALTKEHDDRVQDMTNLENSLDAKINTTNENLDKEALERAKQDELINKALELEIADRKQGDLNLKDDLNNYPRLDNGLIPSTFLPSYVDDVLEYDNLASFPRPGETGKIYVTKDTNLTYRWTGSEYVEISKSLAVGTTSGTAFDGKRGVNLEGKVNDINKTIENMHYFTSINIGKAGTVDASSHPDISFTGGTNIEISNGKPGEIVFGITGKGLANGFASLDENGKVPEEQLPPIFSGGSSLELGEITGTAYEGSKGKELADKVDDIINGTQTLPYFTSCGSDNGGILASENQELRIEGNQGISTKVLGNHLLIGINTDTMPDDYKKGIANGIAPLGSDGKVSSTYLPDNPPTLTFKTIIADTVGGSTRLSATNDDEITFAANNGLIISASRITEPKKITYSLSPEYIKGLNGGIVPLEEDGKIDEQYIPDDILNLNKLINITYVPATTDYTISQEDRDIIFSGIIPRTAKINGGEMTFNGIVGVVTATVSGNTAYLIVLMRTGGLRKFTISKNSNSVAISDILT